LGHQDPFLSLLIITALAAVVPLISSRFRLVQLPIVVGEIIAGVIIGRSGFNLVEPSETLAFLAEFGFTYLMFLSGLEVDFDMIWGASSEAPSSRWWQRPLPAAFMVLLFTFTLGLLSSLGLSHMGLVQNPLLMGLILSTTSLGIVVPVLKERALLGSRYGQALLLAALLADFVTLFLLTVVIAAMSHGLTLDLLLVLVLVVVFALVVRLGKRFVHNSFWRQALAEISSATAQIHVRGAFALMVAWVVLAQALGVEVILGAFLAGAMVSLLATEGEESPLREKLDAIGYGFFIPIFFISVGINLDLGILLASPRSIVLVVLLVVLAYGVKLIPALVYRAQFSWRETLAGGFLLSSRLSLIIAAAAIALDIGAISKEVNAAIILVAVITCTLSPFFFNRLYPHKEEAHREGVIIVGGDQIAELLARRLRRSGEKVTIIAVDRRRLEALRKAGHEVVLGSPIDEEVLRRAGAERAYGLVAVTTNMIMRYRVCELARETFGIPVVVARVASWRMVERLRSLGVRIVQPTLSMVLTIEGILRYPAMFDVLIHQEDDIKVGEAVVRNRTLTGVPLRRLHLPGNALILSIRRGTESIVPHGDAVLRLGDRVALIGTPESVAQALVILQGQDVD